MEQQFVASKPCSCCICTFLLWIWTWIWMKPFVCGFLGVAATKKVLTIFFWRGKKFSSCGASIRASTKAQNFAWRKTIPLINAKPNKIHPQQQATGDKAHSFHSAGFTPTKTASGQELDRQIPPLSRQVPPLSRQIPPLIFEIFTKGRQIQAWWFALSTGGRWFLSFSLASKNPFCWWRLCLLCWFASSLAAENASTAWALTR